LTISDLTIIIIELSSRVGISRSRLGVIITFIIILVIRIWG
jgi:hypothetical protein